MKVLLDTNVVLRASDASDPQHGLVTQALTILTEGGYEACICDQNLYEFWVVATRPPAVNGFGLSPADARAEVEVQLATHTSLGDPPDLRDRWLDLCEKHAVSGVKAHDARLVAWMLGYGIQHLITLNAADFARYTGIQAVTPQEVIAGALPEVRDEDV